MPVRARLVAVLVAVTVVFGTTAPDASFTVPEIRPTTVWAQMLAAVHAVTRRMPQTNLREKPWDRVFFSECMVEPPKGIRNGGRQDQLPHICQKDLQRLNWRICAAAALALRARKTGNWMFRVYATIGAANAGAATKAAAPRNRGCSSTDTVLISVRAARSVRARSANAAFTDDSIKSHAAIISPPI